MDRMACVELPAFPLQLLLKRHPDWVGRPVAVVDRDKPQGVILWVNEEARAARIRAGMRYSAGLSLAHALHAGEVPPADIERGVKAIADRLHWFSPDVEPCRDEPGVFWLNASGLSRLHASPAPVSRRAVQPIPPAGADQNPGAQLDTLAQRSGVEPLSRGERGEHQRPAHPTTRSSDIELPRTIRRSTVKRDHQPPPDPCQPPRPDAGGKCGLGRWAQEIVASLRMCGFRAAVAVGFTRFGTHAIARTLTSDEPMVVIPDRAVERMQAGRVRLSRLGIDPVLRDSLHMLGIRTVGAFLRLPSDGIRRRFGPEAQRLHRLAAGDLWSPLQPQPVIEPLVARCDLDDPETDAVRLLFHLKRLLDRVLATVAARHQALAELTMRLRLDGADAHVERLRPAAPTLDIVLLMNLVRLRLESLSLGAGVIELHVTGSAVAVAAVQQGLFAERPSRDRAAAERALARVRAEFGDGAVVRAQLCEAHLPEARFAWEPVGTVSPPEPREVACRPMVRRIHARALALPEPRGEKCGSVDIRWGRTIDRLSHDIGYRSRGPVETLWPQQGTGEKWGPGPEPGSRSVREEGAGYVRDLAGPYLVSGGWWRSAVHREYYFARTSDDDMLWIYYDRQRRRWRWQGQVE